MALFDRDRATWERPLAGSERWMERLQEGPERFRLFVELWTYAQRDERLRERLAERAGDAARDVRALRRRQRADAGFDTPPGVAEQFANVMLGLGLGLSMLKLTDPEAVSGRASRNDAFGADPRDRVQRSGPAGVQGPRLSCGRQLLPRLPRRELFLAAFFFTPNCLRAFASQEPRLCFERLNSLRHFFSAFASFCERVNFTPATAPQPSTGIFVCWVITAPFWAVIVVGIVSF